MVIFVKFYNFGLVFTFQIEEKRGVRGQKLIGWGVENGWIEGLGVGMRYGQLNKFYNFGLIFTFKIEEKKEGGEGSKWLDYRIRYGKWGLVIWIKFYNLELVFTFQIKKN